MINKAVLPVVLFISFFINFQVHADTQGEVQGGLGHGWSSDNHKPLISACVDKGTVTYTGVPSSSLSLDERYSYDDVKEQLNLDTGGGISLPGFFSMSGDAQYSQMLENTTFSQAFTYRAHVKLKNRIYNAPTDKNPLTWIGQQYAKEPQKFREFCGDKFIAQQEIGGSLYISIKFNFFTQKDKETFNESFEASGIGSLFDFHEKFNKVINSVKKRGHVAIIAHQIGGEPAYLSEILGTTEKGNIAVAKCSLGDIADCEKALGKALAYASQADNHGFPSQFSNDNPGANGPAVLKNIPQEYGFIVPGINTGKSFVTPAITKAREALAKAYKSNLSQYNLVFSTKNNGLPYVQKSRDTLNGLLEKLQANLTTLGTAADSSCYSGDLSDCVTESNHATSKLIKVDTSFLSNMKTWLLILNSKSRWRGSPVKFHAGQTLETTIGNLFFTYVSGDFIEPQYCFMNIERERPVVKYHFEVTPTSFNGACSTLAGRDQVYYKAKSSDSGKTYVGMQTGVFRMDMPFELREITN